MASSSDLRSTATNPPPQSLYDAVARGSQPDRYLRHRKVNAKSGKRHSGRPVAPEEVLANRWGRQLKRIGKQNEGEDGDGHDAEIDQNTKLVQNGLVLSGERDEALPDSVRPLLE